MQLAPNHGKCPLCGAELEKRDAIVVGNGMWMDGEENTPDREDADDVYEAFYENCPECRYTY